ncbi:hypothetical protein ABZ756_12835 [Mammaliicoccus sciuri]|uniref:Uncharacterized protein n=1 Tax=Sporosarcina newyorkensis TaxID=759851 RepID=A0A1T4Z0Y2_9BACL|nr:MULTISPECIES: hypothetical protein [Sporosarcina]MBY0224006.1 hypothetical protein [Sporosarcina aquimarina]SKB07195.1 hypothetical protein SAMN04244570_0331 [Sporosarcina newyorkensis]
MEFRDINEQIIQKYKEDETLMIRLFVQWCANHELDPQMLYRNAYPNQPDNAALLSVMEEDDGLDELQIDNETMLDVLQLFGNEDLAFAVADEIQRLN